MWIRKKNLHNLIQSERSGAYRSGKSEAMTLFIPLFHKIMYGKPNLDECTTDTCTFTNGKKEANITWEMMRYGRDAEAYTQLKRLI